jgi:hypothetical protein
MTQSKLYSECLVILQSMVSLDYLTCISSLTPSAIGRSLAVIPRAFASEGYVDLESDDLAPEDNLYAFEQMALNMKV